MESDDLLVTLGLSSFGSDLRENWKRNSNQYKEWNYLNQEWTVSAFLIRIPEFRINSKDHGSRRGEM